MLSTKDFLRQLQQGSQYFPLDYLNEVKATQQNAGKVVMPNGKLLTHLDYDIAGGRNHPVIKITAVDLV